MYLNTSSIDEIVFKTNLLNKQVMETVELRKQRSRTAPNTGSTIQQGKTPRTPPASSGVGMQPPTNNQAGSFLASRQLLRTPPNKEAVSIVKTTQIPRQSPKKPTSLQLLHSKKMGYSSPSFRTEPPIINVEQEIRDIKEELKLMNRNMEQIINRLNQL